MLVDRMEILHVDDVGNGFDVAAETGKTNRIVKALAARGIDRIIHGVVGDGRRDGAGDDAVQGTGAGQAAELQGFKQERRGGIERLDVRTGQTVVQPEARERKLAKRILRENSEARAVLHVVLDILGIDADRLLEQDGFLAGLVKVITRRENRETGGDGPVEKIRLGETEHKGARQAAKLSGEGKRFAKAQEIVGLI